MGARGIARRVPSGPCKAPVAQDRVAHANPEPHRNPGCTLHNRHACDGRHILFRAAHLACQSCHQWRTRHVSPVMAPFFETQRIGSHRGTVFQVITVKASAACLSSSLPVLLSASLPGVRIFYNAGFSVQRRCRSVWDRATSPAARATGSNPRTRTVKRETEEELEAVAVSGHG